MLIPKSNKYPPIKYCIYCGERNSSLLTDEHIIPFSLGGKLLLPQASCNSCAKVTRGITETIARSMYGRLRVRLDAPTRNRKERPSTFPLVVVNKNGIERQVNIPATLWPRSYPVLILQEAGILSGIAPTEFQVQIRDHAEDISDLYERGFLRKDENIRFTAMLDAGVFCRQLAQIAHAFTMALIGSNGYQDFLIPRIMNQTIKPSDYFMYIGSVATDQELQSQIALDILERRGNSLVACRFQCLDLVGGFQLIRSFAG